MATTRTATPTQFQAALTRAYAQLDAFDGRLRVAHTQYFTARTAARRRAALRRVRRVLRALRRACKD
jgi:hypothetical protein